MLPGITSVSWCKDSLLIPYRREGLFYGHSVIVLVRRFLERSLLNSNFLILTAGLHGTNYIFSAEYFLGQITAIEKHLFLIMSFSSIQCVLLLFFQPLSSTIVNPHLLRTRAKAKWSHWRFIRPEIPDDSNFPNTRTHESWKYALTIVLNYVLFMASWTPLSVVFRMQGSRVECGVQFYQLSSL